MEFKKIFSNLQHALCTTNFPVVCFKPKQIQVFENILNGSDVIAVLPTGYGKSCLFQLFPRMVRSDSKGIVIVVSPLNSIIIDQINSLRKICIKADIFKNPKDTESAMPSPS